VKDSEKSAMFCIFWVLKSANGLAAMFSCKKKKILIINRIFHFKTIVHTPRGTIQHTGNQGSIAQVDFDR
jgi:hypothetical protein